MKQELIDMMNEGWKVALYDPKTFSAERLVKYREYLKSQIDKGYEVMLYNFADLPDIPETDIVDHETKEVIRYSIDGAEELTKKAEENGNLYVALLNETLSGLVKELLKSGS